MPEGPEVNVIKDGLNNVIKNKLIVSVNLPESSKFLKKTPDGYNDFKDDLPLKCIEVKSKGKMIYFVFEKGWYLICRLLMSGGWFIEKASKHNHFEMVYQKIKGKEKENGNETETNSIWFVDPRHFGTLKWTQDKSVLESVLKDIGPDLLNDKDKISGEDYLNKMKNSKNGKKKIAVVLMDQSVFSGVGNYLKSEILYQAKVSPNSIISNIPDEKLKEIFQISLDKIKMSYKAGGASIRDYSDIKGNEGKYSFNLVVYKKKKDPLGNTIIMEKTKDGRSTYWVPEEQILF
jgi:DNA-formamidopyrimidine glycosylase